MLYGKISKVYLKSVMYKIPTMPLYTLLGIYVKSNVWKEPMRNVTNVGMLNMILKNQKCPTAMTRIGNVGKNLIKCTWMNMQMMSQ